MKDDLEKELNKWRKRKNKEIPEITVEKIRRKDFVTMKELDSYENMMKRRM